MMAVRFATEKSKAFCRSRDLRRQTRALCELVTAVHLPAPADDAHFGPDDLRHAGRQLHRRCQGGILFTSANEGLAWWTQSLRCDCTAMTHVKNKVTFDGYVACRSRAVVRMITVDEMTHMWPNKEDGLDGTKLLLDFSRTRPRIFPIVLSSDPLDSVVSARLFHPSRQ